MSEFLYIHILMNPHCSSQSSFVNEINLFLWKKVNNRMSQLFFMIQHHKYPAPCLFILYNTHNAAFWGQVLISNKHLGVSSLFS